MDVLFPLRTIKVQTRSRTKLRFEVAQSEERVKRDMDVGTVRQGVTNGYVSEFRRTERKSDLMRRGLEEIRFPVLCQRNTLRRVKEIS